MSIDLGKIIGGIVGGDEITKDDVSTEQGTQTGTVKDNASSTQNTKSSQQTGTVNATTSNSKTSTSSTTRNLSDAQIANLNDTLGKLKSSFNPANLSGIQNVIEGDINAVSTGAQAALVRALQGDDKLASTLDPILAKASQDTNKNIASIVAQTSRGAGSKFNSLVTKVGADAASKGAVDLAALGAGLIQSNRKQVTDEINTAIANLANATQTSASAGVIAPRAEADIDATRATAIANIGNVLKGAVVDSNSIADTVTNSRNETQSTTNSVAQVLGTNDSTKTLDLNTTSNKIGKGTTSDPTGILDILKAL